MGTGEERDDKLLRELRKVQGSCPDPKCCGGSVPLFERFLSSDFRRSRCRRTKSITYLEDGRKRRNLCNKVVECGEERRQQLFE